MWTRDKEFNVATIRIQYKPLSKFQLSTYSEWCLSSSETSFSYSERSSRPEVFCTKDILKNFAKFTGKHQCQSLFFNKVADLRLAILLEKRRRYRYFPVDFAKFLRTPFSTEHLQWLLLKIISYHTKEILYVNINFMGNKLWSKNKHFLLLLILVLKKPVF